MTKTLTIKILDDGDNGIMTSGRVWHDPDLDRWRWRTRTAAGESTTEHAAMIDVAMAVIDEIYQAEAQ